MLEYSGPFLPAVRRQRHCAERISVRHDRGMRSTECPIYIRIRRKSGDLPETVQVTRVTNCRYSRKKLRFSDRYLASFLCRTAPFSITLHDLLTSFRDLISSTANLVNVSSRVQCAAFGRCCRGRAICWRQLSLLLFCDSYRTGRAR